MAVLQMKLLNTDPCKHKSQLDGKLGCLPPAQVTCQKPWQDLKKRWMRCVGQQLGQAGSWTHGVHIKKESLIKQRKRNLSLVVQLSMEWNLERKVRLKRGCRHRLVDQEVIKRRNRRHHQMGWDTDLYMQSAPKTVWEHLRQVLNCFVLHLAWASPPHHLQCRALYIRHR